MSLTDSRFAPVEEMIHGVMVRDPYRWLEDRSLPETEEWIRKQQHRCDDYFAQCENLPAIRERVREYLDVEVIDQPAKVGDRYFYRRRAREQEQASICMRDQAGNQRLLVDPSSLGPFASVSIHRIAEGGSLLAYELKLGGGDRKSIRVVDVESGCILSGSIETGYARGFAFTSDLQGFFYCHEPAKNSGDHSIHLQRFGNPSKDHVCFTIARTFGSRLKLVADSIHLGAIYMRQVGGAPVIDFFIARKRDPERWHHVFRNRKLPYGVILRHSRIYALDYAETPNGSLLELNDDGERIRTIVPEQQSTIRQINFVNDRVYLNFIDRLNFSVHSWNIAGVHIGLLDHPPNGTIELLPNYSDESRSAFYSYESFAEPLTIYEYTADTAKSELWHQRRPSVEPSRCSVSQVNCPARDGVAIPLALVSCTESGPQAQSPVIMTSYGGFGVQITPQFSVLAVILMELGAIFALPSIRGGGEFGREWHGAARGHLKQVAFDDFLAAAEWLCAHRIAVPERLAIFGGSNSGLLVGAAMTQRPDLFRAAICIAPLLDMVRYEHFDQAAKWRQEYGTVEDAEEFAALYAYSPYHHIKEEMSYPSVLFVSGDQDDRCNPAHVRKMAAKIQSCASQSSPIIVDYSRERGHSPVLPLSVRIDALSRRIAFLCREMDISIRFWRLP